MINHKNFLRMNEWCLMTLHFVQLWNTYQVTQQWSMSFIWGLQKSSMSLTSTATYHQKLLLLLTTKSIVSIIPISNNPVPLLGRAICDFEDTRLGICPHISIVCLYHHLTERTHTMDDITLPKLFIVPFHEVLVVAFLRHTCRN